jgi:hypothetical protein
VYGPLRIDGSDHCQTYFFGAAAMLKCAGASFPIKC